MFLIFAVIVWLAIGLYLFNNPEHIDILAPKTFAVSTDPLRRKAIAITWPVTLGFVWAFYYVGRLAGKNI